MGLTNSTLPSMNNITGSLNFDNPACMLVSINHIIMDDIAIFSFLLLLTIIVFIGLQVNNKSFMQNIMYSSAITGMIGIFLWLVRCEFVGGQEFGMLTTWQMWILPTIAVLMALLLKMTDKE